MPPYWLDKPHRPARRSLFNNIGYRLYLRFGRKSRLWERFWSEREIFRVLRVISRQQIYGFVANPEGGDPIWDLDAPADVQENRYPMNTCLLRGWIEELDISNHSYKGFPIAQPLFSKGASLEDLSRPPYYRMTTAGWNALYRNYTISRIALIVSILALTVSAVVAITNWQLKAHRPVLAHTPRPLSK